MCAKRDGVWRAKTRQVRRKLARTIGFHNRQGRAYPSAPAVAFAIDRDERIPVKVHIPSDAGNGSKINRGELVSVEAPCDVSDVAKVD